jgi:hypothetical protein
MGLAQKPGASLSEDMERASSISSLFQECESAVVAAGMRLSLKIIAKHIGRFRSINIGKNFLF